MWFIVVVVSIVVALGVGMVGGQWLVLRYKLAKHIDEIVRIVTSDMTDAEKIKALAELFGIWPW